MLYAFSVNVCLVCAITWKVCCTSFVSFIINILFSLSLSVQHHSMKLKIIIWEQNSSSNIGNSLCFATDVTVLGCCCCCHSYFSIEWLHHILQATFCTMKICTHKKLHNDNVRALWPMNILCKALTLDIYHQWFVSMNRRGKAAGPEHRLAWSY